ncbi:MAG: acyltransferase [Ruminococcus sp.]|nr:acyltransferase [Ruminococcus sp.]
MGNNCIFGPNCCVFDHDHLIENKVVKKNEYSVSQISIGEGTWIGAGVIILKGAHIGNGCVIGAGCIVKGDIPDYSIVTSNRDLIIKDLY